MFQRVVDNRGLNVPEYQYSSFAENTKNECVIIPSTSQVSFGGYSTFDFKEKSLLLNDIVLQFNISNVVGGTSKTTAGPDSNLYPRTIPVWAWFTRIEIVQNNNIIDTIYPIANFLQHQCFVTDEQRKKFNQGAGIYNESTLCYNKLYYKESFYLPLWTYFKNSHMPMLYPKDDLQIRLYLDNLSNLVIVDPASSTPAFSCSLTCNLICNITRLGQDVNLYRLQSLNRKLEHYKFLELRYGTYAISAGASSATIVMNSVTGSVAYLFAVVRPQSKSSSMINGAYQNFFYYPVLNFSILDSTSTNITGGQVIPFSLLQQYLSRKFTESSYYDDAWNITGSTPGSWYSPTCNSFAILYSFAEDPISGANSGVSSGSFRFQGSEQLQMQFQTALPEGVNIDIYAFVESVIEVSPTYVKKINL
jgi:hypothetical protein